MNNGKLVHPSLEAQKLLAMPTSEAEALFQSYEAAQQLDIILSTRDPKAREALYYLVPDCTELIQMSPTEDVLQVLDMMLGTGMTSVLLPCLAPEQFEEIMDLVLWRNGKLDEKTLNLWLFELAACDTEELGRLLSQIDLRILAHILRGRVETKTPFNALFIEEGLIDPASIDIEYSDERARAIMDAVWEAGGDVFINLLYELFVLDEYDVDHRFPQSIEYAREERNTRVRERDRAAGIDVTEEDIFEKVDLDELDLEEGDTNEDDEDDKEDDDV